MNTVRAKLIVLQEPLVPDAPRGTCRWCGESILLVEGHPVQSVQRVRHKGDKWEEGNRDCNREFRLSMCWSARDALRWEASQEDRLINGCYEIRCEDCGELCEVGRPRQRPKRVGFHKSVVRTVKSWEADHETPLADGGTHTLDNFRARCTDCHKLKTKQENAERLQNEGFELAHAQGELG